MTLPSLLTIQSGVAIKPPRILLMGTPGIGKTTFASQAPKPIFIQAEDGADVVGCDRFPLVHSFTEIMDILHILSINATDYRTIVIDSLDPVSAMVEQVVAKEHSEKERAYGKDTAFALEKWRTMLDALSWLRDEKGFIIILIAHTQIKRFDNPECDSYERYIPRLNEKVAGLVSAWSDAHLFASYKVYTKETEVGFNKDVRRGVGVGERIIYTSERPSHLAKSRYAIPHELPMNWISFSNAVTASASKAVNNQPAN